MFSGGNNAGPNIHHYLYYCLWPLQNDEYYDDAEVKSEEKATKGMKRMNGSGAEGVEGVA